MDYYSERRKRIFFGILAVLLTICLALLAFRVFWLLEQYYGRIDTSGDDDYGYRSGGLLEYFVDGKWYVPKSKMETYLLIGIDKFVPAIRSEEGYRNSEQSDALFLLSVDRKSETYSVLHINRDTMANIRMLDMNGKPYNTFVGQIALSHTYGSGREDSCENTVWSVSDFLFGLKIDHFASFSMDAVAVINDKVGGVTLTVSDDMTVVDKELVEGATVTLKGEQALLYVRARSELANSTNIERMKRQRQYIEAFLEQAKKAISENRLLPTDIFFSISDYLVSDMTAEELNSFSEVVNDYTFTGITTIEGEAWKGEQFMEFYADDAVLKQMVLETFYEEK